jgi:hypothetical protein
VNLLPAAVETVTDMGAGLRSRARALMGRLASCRAALPLGVLARFDQWPLAGWAV